MKSGPIIVIEDDTDDKEILESVLSELEIDNKLLWFNNCLDAFDYLLTTPDHPFIIFCDVNLPKQNGVEFKKQIDDNPYLRKKSIPFVFYSTTADQPTVTKAYTEMTVQGFFQKSYNYDEIKKNIKLIIEYWKTCKHPNAV
jgi:response regulator RpfG family c-di-GMP phosphodiesterase